MPNKKTDAQKRAEEQLDRALKDSFPASDPPASTVPAAEDIIPPGAGIPPPKREEKILTERELTPSEQKKVEKREKDANKRAA